MEQKNCKVCGKMFLSNRNDICPDCLRKDEECFQLVRKFLKEFPGSKIYAVVKYTGVSEKRIHRYLREGRLEITDVDQDFLLCMKCGKPIKTGKYCDACYSKFLKNVHSLYNEEKEKKKEGGKMRFFTED